MFIYNMAWLDKHNDIDTHKVNRKNRLILAKSVVKWMYICVCYSTKADITLAVHCLKNSLNLHLNEPNFNLERGSSGANGLEMC